MDIDQLIAVKERAEQAWRTSCQFARVQADLADWETHLTPDGAPMLTAKVTGFRRASALRKFGADGVTLPTETQRPVLDYSIPGRIQCEWRDSGVWVQLWHPDTTLPTPAVLAAFPKPQHPMAVAATPSGRLRFRRNKKERTAS